MALLQKLLPSLVPAVLIGAGLLLVQRLLRQRKLPELPLRLSLLALLCWALLPLLNDLPVSAGYRPWLALLDELFLALAGLRVALWLLMELPAGLGWWRRPPELMLQLLMLGAGAVVTVIVVRELARVDLVGLLTTSAVLTAVLGLAAQETLKDLFAGLELQLGDDFSLGDWLELSDGARGIVETITWRDTMLLTLDGCRLVIPNSKITAELIINRSASGVISNRFEVGLDYDYPPDRALAMLESVARQNGRVLGEPAAKASLKAFGDSAITYEFAEKPSLRENGPAAQSRCEVTGSAAAPCSPTCRLRSGSRPVIRCGGSGNWRIRPSIGSISPFARSTPQKAGPRCRQNSCCWPRCCRRSTGFARSGFCWSSCTTTCCTAGLWA